MIEKRCSKQQEIKKMSSQEEYNKSYEKKIFKKNLLTTFVHLRATHSQKCFLAPTLHLSQIAILNEGLPQTSKN